MYIFISIFYLSLLGILLMIYLKSREVKNGKPNIVARLFSRTDHKFQSIFDTTYRWFSYINKHTFVWLAHWVAFHILTHVRNWYIKIRLRAHENPHFRKLINRVRGRAEVNSHGASFYLKRISNQDW